MTRRVLIHIALLILFIPWLYASNTMAKEHALDIVNEAYLARVAAKFLLMLKPRSAIRNSITMN